MSAIISTPQFVREARSAGLLQNELNVIQNRLLRTQDFGRFFLPIYDDLQYPLFGYYVRRFGFGEIEFGREFHVLTLQLGSEFVPRLFNISKGPEWVAPWLSLSQCKLLRRTGLILHSELRTVTEG